jgi:hypothetical protein
LLQKQTATAGKYGWALNEAVDHPVKPGDDGVHAWDVKFSKQSNVDAEPSSA